MTVAVSRARLGLYILGRRDVFAACPELRPAFDLLLERPDKLMLVTGEMFQTERLNSQGISTVEGEVQMENIEHLGQYVYEMTNTKLKQMHNQDEGAANMAPETITEDADEDEAQANYNDEDEQSVEPDILEVREDEHRS